MKRLLFLLISILTPVLAYQAMPYLVKLSLEYRSSVYLFPYLVFITTTLLAWRFNRSRIFFSTLLILLVYVALKMSHEFVDLLQQRLLFLVSLLLPLNMLLLSLLKERGIFTQHGLLRFAILAVQGALVWWIVNDENMPGFEYLSAPRFTFPALIETQSGIPQLGWLVILGVSIWFIIKLMMHPKLFESSMLAALALIMLAVSQPVDTTSMVLFFWFAGMLLLITLIQDSYGMAYMDELTGLPGRRALMNTLMSMGKCYSIAMLDIDHFKKFNDTHGHDIGDQVLRKVAAQIGKVTGGGRPARYGGEEFAIVFPGKDRKAVIEYLEVVRQNIENDLFTIRGKDRPKKAPGVDKKPRKSSNKQVKVTVSIGVAERNDKLITTDDVMQAADKALYRAKRKGRNQVCK